LDIRKTHGKPDNVKKRDQSEELSVDGRVILN
jgi:hypothetical protein